MQCHAVDSLELLKNDLDQACSVMRTVAIIYTECSIRVYYDDCSIRSSISIFFIQIQVAEKWSRLCKAPALLSTTVYNHRFYLCGTVLNAV